MSHDDFDFEPIPGLPAKPPKGETLLWQGSPDWRLVARDVLHLEAIGTYFAILLSWRLLTGVMAGLPASVIANNAAWILGLASIALGVLAVIAWAIARTTIYSITSQRVVMRIGVALPITFNLPFKMMAGAGTAQKADASGDIALQLMPGQRLAYAVLWPHARPWKLTSPQPSLRCLADVQAVSGVLAQALAAHAAAAIVPNQRTLVAESAGQPGRLRPQLQAAE